MTDTSDINELRSDLEAFLKRLPEEVLRPSMRQASRLIGESAVSRYMQQTSTEAGVSRKRRARHDKGPLRILSGRLARSLTGARTDTGSGLNTPESINRITVSQSEARLVKGSRVPYARIHELGGFIPVTPRMRRYFWAKYYEAIGGGRTPRNTGVSGSIDSSFSIGLNTEAQFWKRMALMRTTVIPIPARPYLAPALRDSRDEILRFMAEKWTDLAQRTLQR